MATPTSSERPRKTRARNEAFERPLEFHEKTLEIARDIGDRRGGGMSLYNFGDEPAKSGERGHAIARLQEAPKILGEIAAPYGDRARPALARLKCDD